MSYDNLMLSSAKLELARRRMIDFVLAVKRDYIPNWHHQLLCEYLDAFQKGEIKKLMVFMPPQHGKSELVSRNLPAFLLGKNPKTKIIGCSYSADLSTQFNRSVQRIIDNEVYANIFPKTRLNSVSSSNDAKRGVLRNANIFETIEHYGFYKSVGVGGSLTGTAADIAIIDDPVKDAVQATSPVFQQRVWEWYDQVLETRLHNESKVILTMTRWDKWDLAGRILEKQSDWEVLILEGIKERVFHPKDPRNSGEALWESKHSLKRLEKKRGVSERAFNALYQQRPDRSATGLVYPNWVSVGFSEYEKLKTDKGTIYGLDFGFSSDELAIVECYSFEKKLFVKEVLYQRGLTNSALIEIFGVLNISKNAYIYADSASPDRISELQKAGYNVISAIKGPGSVMAGISKVNEFEINIAEKSDNLQNEIVAYRYKENAQGEALPSIAEGKDHLLDALRYAVFTRSMHMVEISNAQRVKKPKNRNERGS